MIEDNFFFEKKKKSEFLGFSLLNNNHGNSTFFIDYLPQIFQLFFVYFDPWNFNILFLQCPWEDLQRFEENV